MVESLRAVVWLTLAGALGGGLNALLSDNGFVWPRRAVAGRHRVLCPGLVLSAVVGGAMTWVVFQAFAANACEPLNGAGGNLLGAVAAVIVGGLSARRLIEAADQRFLRAAVREASSAPAAHPDVLLVVEAAPAHVVYAKARDLAVRPRDPSYDAS